MAVDPKRFYFYFIIFLHICNVYFQFALDFSLSSRCETIWRTECALSKQYQSYVPRSNFSSQQIKKAANKYKVLEKVLCTVIFAEIFNSQCRQFLDRLIDIKNPNVADKSLEGAEDWW
jgi:hypothetical protein